uniref:Putative secreted protein n=1 Tax=Anopheles darlingi TaxID=43151 RepID=A0A2M4DFZ3_ANODA
MIRSHHSTIPPCPGPLPVHIRLLVTILPLVHHLPLGEAVYPSAQHLPALPVTPPFACQTLLTKRKCCVGSSYRLSRKSRSSSSRLASSAKFPTNHRHRTFRLPTAVRLLYCFLQKLASTS